jgi:hypothetical protein
MNGTNKQQYPLLITTSLLSPAHIHGYEKVNYHVSFHVQVVYIEII